MTYDRRRSCVWSARSARSSRDCSLPGSPRTTCAWVGVGGTSRFPRTPSTGPPSADRRLRRGRDLMSRAAVDVAPLREYPEFRRLWVGQAISFVGGEVTYVAMPFQVYKLTHSTLALGLFALTQ